MLFLLFLDLQKMLNDKSHLLNLLNALNSVKLLVVGDVMLDQYWFGDVNRISPEAPVPIIKVNRSEIRCGGAANVAINAATLGVNSVLLSLIGNDEAGKNLQNLVEKQQNLSPIFHIDQNIATIVKLRVISRQQQLLRIDFEAPPSPQILSAKLLDFTNQIQQNLPDLIILSDYGKGALTHSAEMIKIANSAKVPIFIDPKGNDYRKYKNADLLTPNRQELAQVVGAWHDESDLILRAENLRQALNLKALLVTRSEEGMTLIGENNVVIHQTARAKEVYDVSGAGDTVIATLSAAKATGASWDLAMKFATLAAGIVVGKLGTATVNSDELIAEINKI